MAKKKPNFFQVAERVALGVATGGLSEVARGGLSLARNFNQPPHGRLHAQRRHTRRKEAALHTPHPHALKGHKQGVGMARKVDHVQGKAFVAARPDPKAKPPPIPPPPGRLFAQRRHEARVKNRLARISRRSLD